jgi:hypothetical protein
MPHPQVKNARTQLAQRLRELRAVCRIIISGTPVQNNLAELHALLDFAVPGLLGGPREFKAVFEKPIAAGQDRSAGLRVRELGAAKAAELRRIVAPFMLRREKKEVFGGGNSSSSGSGSAAGGETSSSGGAVVAAAAAVSSSSGSSAAAAAAAESKAAAAAAVPAMMGVKHDLVVWLRLQPLQRHIYEAFLHSDAVKAALNSSKSPLAALTVLKKVCDHPALLSERATKLVLTGEDVACSERCSLHVLTMTAIIGIYGAAAVHTVRLMQCCRARLLIIQLYQRFDHKYQRFDHKDAPEGQCCLICESNSLFSFTSFVRWHAEPCVLLSAGALLFSLQPASVASRASPSTAAAAARRATSSGAAAWMISL